MCKQPVIVPKGDLLIQKLNQIIFCKAALSQDSRSECL
jgi:hypothetical protein